MTEKRSAKKVSQKSAKNATTDRKKFKGFSAAERAAMRERVEELKADARPARRGGKADGESTVLAKIAAMRGTDRAIAERLHSLIKAAAPDLVVKTWYGMPAYAKNGKVVCFFRAAQTFKERYMTVGFTQDANLDQGHLWPTSYALTDLTPAEEAKIGALVKKAVSG
jgi:hypothetical protein